ncbi:MAG: hypothetical protein ABL931_08510 [Usitatibacteraceae bacterium]
MHTPILRKRAPGSPAHILIVNDDRLEAEVMREAIADMEANAQIDRVADLEEAMAYLSRGGAYAARPLGNPDLIIGKNYHYNPVGTDLTKAIRENPSLKSIAVVIFAGAGTAEEILEAYQVGVTACLLPARDDDEFISNLHGVVTRWLP